MASFFYIWSTAADCIRKIKEALLEVMVKKWLNPGHNLVKRLIFFGVKQVDVLLREGLINFGILF